MLTDHLQMLKVKDQRPSTCWYYFPLNTGIYLTDHKFGSKSASPLKRFLHPFVCLTCTQNIICNRSLEQIQSLASTCRSPYFRCCFVFSLLSLFPPICALPAPMIPGPSLMCFTCISLPYSSFAPRIEAPVGLHLHARTGCENRGH